MTLDNGVLSVVFGTRIGARITSLRDLRSGREWLLGDQPPAPAPPRYGDDFSRHHCGGFDECFPNVAPDAEPQADAPWPDHGELWTAAWTVERDGDRVRCVAEGLAWPYRFTREARLAGDTLELAYRLENGADRPFPHLWSAHPLLRVHPGMTIDLPGVAEVFVNWSSDPALGFGDRLPWPCLRPGLDVSRVPDAQAGFAAKLFAEGAPAGRAALVDPAKGHRLQFSWDPSEVQELGVWLCYGGWPDDGRAPHYTVALEPATGMPDALGASKSRARCATLAPNQQSSWSLRIQSLLP